MPLDPELAADAERIRAGMGLSILANDSSSARTAPTCSKSTTSPA
jgi:hypothetical protein